MGKKDLTELIHYGICGAATVIFSFVSYFIFGKFLDYKIANLFSIVLTKVFAYLANKIIVFRTKTSVAETILEISRYVFYRGISGLADWTGQWVLVEFVSMDDLYAKSLMIIITTIMNYFFGKFNVFKQKERTD